MSEVDDRRGRAGMRAADTYESLAPFYDLGLEGFVDDLALYREFARRQGGAVLELGCGTGRVALSLTEQEVVGLDSSAGMLHVAAAKLPQEQRGRSVSFVQADMRRFALGRVFGLILIALDSFLHLAEQRDQIACLRAVRAHLAPGALLLLDLPAPGAPGWEDWSPGVHPLVLAWSRALADGSRISKFSSFSADAAAQSHLVTEIYERSDAEGSLRRWTVEYSLRYVFPAELEFLLDAAGLRLRTRYGDYELGPFVAESPRQFCVVEATGRRSRGQARGASAAGVALCVGESRS